MTIKRFSRNPAFFQNLVFTEDDLEKGHTIDAIDYDQQFKALVNYINGVLVERINDFTQGVLNGLDTPGSENMLFKNLADGNTEWSFINGDESFYKGEISFSKLEQAPAGTVLTAYQDGEFIANKSLYNNDLVFKVNTNNLNELEPSWGLITGNNFEEESLDGSLLIDETLTSDNLRAGTLIVNVGNNTVDTRHFADSSIPSSKILPGDFEEAHFAPDPDLPNSQGIIESIRSYNIKKGSITPSKFRDLSVGFWVSNFKDGVKIPTEKLLDESITDAHLIPVVFQGHGDSPINGVIPQRMLAPGFQIQSEHINLNGIAHLFYFADDVRAALRAKGISAGMPL